MTTISDLYSAVSFRVRPLRPECGQECVLLNLTVMSQCTRVSLYVTTARNESTGGKREKKDFQAAISFFIVTSLLF